MVDLCCEIVSECGVLLHLPGPWRGAAHRACPLSNGFIRGPVVAGTPLPGIHRYLESSVLSQRRGSPPHGRVERHDPAPSFVADKKEPAGLRVSKCN
jgi:hypothetical protein